MMLSLDLNNKRMDNNICFIIMGFGKKKDPDTNRTIDLDTTYKKIIRPAVESSGCKCIRADEIVESGLIDRSMYALLYYADIVIADISTFNPNAIYELGVRHALRPYSTIIIKEDEGKIPFDIGHDRIISYKHLGNEISDLEAKKSISQLHSLIQNIIKEPKTDSPLYSYIHQIKKHEISSIIGELKSNEDSIYALTEAAKEKMQNGEFIEAEKLWSKLCSKAENEKYYIQQQALCRYKSEKPSPQRALTDALQIITKIEGQTDTETLGILGAIYKRLWNITSDRSYLDSAIDAYKRGWFQYKDFYTGENYATCMYIKSKIETSAEMKTHSIVEAQLTYKEIINIILETLKEQEPEELLWKYASLSNAYLALKEYAEAEKYEKLFNEQQPQRWQKDTFEETKLIIQS